MDAESFLFRLAVLVYPHIMESIMGYRNRLCQLKIHRLKAPGLHLQAALDDVVIPICYVVLARRIWRSFWPTDKILVPQPTIAVHIARLYVPPVVVLKGPDLVFVRGLGEAGDGQQQENQ